MSHVNNVHTDIIKYECNECDFKATLKKGLKIHTESIHKGLRYNCNECGFKATKKQSLKRHALNQHKQLDLAIHK